MYLDNCMLTSVHSIVTRNYSRFSYIGKWRLQELLIHNFSGDFFEVGRSKMGSDFGNPLRKFKLVFLGEQSGKYRIFTQGNS